MSDHEMEIAAAALEAAGTQPLAESASEGEETTAAPSAAAAAAFSAASLAAPAFAAAMAQQQPQQQPSMLMRAPSLVASPSPITASALTGTAPPGGANPPPAAVAVARKRTAKPRTSRSKKAKLEDGAAATSTASAAGLDKPPMQRSSSSRRGGGRDRAPDDAPVFSRATSTPQGSYYGYPPELQPSTLFSSTAAMSYVSTRRERVVCLVPGSDTIKIGFADAARPFFVRQLLAYKVPPKAQSTPMPDSSPAFDHKEMKDSSEPTASPSPAVVPSGAAPLSDRDADTLERERDESLLSASDRQLLSRWRRRREADIGACEKALGKKRTAAEKARAARLVQTQGSIHDADHMSILSPQTDAQAPPSSSAPRILHASALLAATPPVPADGPHYLLRRPFARGAFNLSRSTLLSRASEWAEEVLVHALSEQLALSPASFASLSVSLVVPDAWHPHELREFVDLLLTRLHFREVFVVRESVSACFGAGLASACVVDLGASTTTISCVEDGLQLPHTRVTLNYGSADLEAVLRDAITDRAFWTAREKVLAVAAARGPYEESLASLRLDEQVRRWKERYCYCLKAEEDDEDQPESPSALAQPPAFPPHPPTPLPASVPAELHVAAALAPLAMFHPTMLATELHSGAVSHRLAVLDAARAREDPHLGALAASSNASALAPPPPEDPPFDASSLDEELVMFSGSSGAPQSKKDKDKDTPSASPTKAPAPVPFKLDRRKKEHQLLLQTYTEEQLMAGAHIAAEEAAAAARAQKEEEESATARAAAVAASVSSSDSPSQSTPVTSFLSRRQALHLAVARSLQASGGLDTQNRMATSILLTGGGCNLPHLLDCLEERLVDVVPYLIPGVNTVACILHPKGLDSAQLSWRGAAILAKAETTRDMWIGADEWKRYGAGLFREKAPFAC